MELSNGMETARSGGDRSSRDLYVDDHELRRVYERVSEEYERKTEAMLRLAAEPHEVEEFRKASEEVAALWARLRELRTVHLLRLSAPRSTHDEQAGPEGDHPGG